MRTLSVFDSSEDITSFVQGKIRVRTESKSQLQSNLNDRTSKIGNLKYDSDVFTTVTEAEGTVQHLSTLIATF